MRTSPNPPFSWLHLAYRKKWIKQGLSGQRDSFPAGLWLNNAIFNPDRLAGIY
jgi:hypothetical protein